MARCRGDLFQPYSEMVAQWEDAKRMLADESSIPQPQHIQVTQNDATDDKKMMMIIGIAFGVSILAVGLFIVLKMTGLL